MNCCVGISSLFPVINNGRQLACRTHPTSQSLISHPAHLGDVMTAKIGHQVAGMFECHSSAQFHWQSTTGLSPLFVIMSQWSDSSYLENRHPS